VQFGNRDWESVHGQPDFRLKPGEKLKIHTGFKSQATIVLWNGRRLHLGPMNLAIVQGDGKVVRLGEVKAPVGRKGTTRSDFEVRTPVCATGVRGD
jgi:hypothetical protein